MSRVAKFVFFCPDFPTVLDFQCGRGDPSLTEAVATVQPAWTFLLSFAFLFIAPKLGDPLAKQKLWLKLLLVVAMVVGVKLISGE